MIHPTLERQTMKAQQVQQQHIAKTKIKNCLIIICAVSRRFLKTIDKNRNENRRKESSQRKKTNKKEFESKY
jgi:hypothetical protein